MAAYRYFERDSSCEVICSFSYFVFNNFKLIIINLIRNADRHAETGQYQCMISSNAWWSFYSVLAFAPFFSTWPSCSANHVSCRPLRHRPSTRQIWCPTVPFKRHVTFNYFKLEIRQILYLTATVSFHSFRAKWNKLNTELMFQLNQYITLTLTGVSAAIVKLMTRCS